jgi:membrane associated rhomboid family serine protease
MFRQLTPIVRAIFILIITVFLIQYLFGVDFVSVFGLRCVLSKNFAVYQYITHLFIHLGFIHLIGTVFALISFGPILEQTFGSRDFVIFLIVTGLGAALLSSYVHYAAINRISLLYYDYTLYPTPSNFEHYISRFTPRVYELYYQFLRNFYSNPKDLAFIEKSKSIAHDLVFLKMDMPIVGASGIIYGLLMGFAILFPNAELLMLFFPIPIKAKYFVGFYCLYELYSSIHESSIDSLVHFTHLGGAIFAYLFVKIWERKQENY